MENLRQQKQAATAQLGEFPTDLKIALVQPKALAAFRVSKSANYMSQLLAYNECLDKHISPMIVLVEQIKDASRTFKLAVFPLAAKAAKAPRVPKATS